MYATVRNNIYTLVDSIVMGKELITRKKEKTDDSFTYEDGYYTKTLDNYDEITDIYDLRFGVEYNDQLLKDNSKFEISPKRLIHYDLNAEDHEVDLFVSRRCESNGWEMLDNYSSHKNLKLSECSGFYLKYTYKKRNGEYCKEPVEIEIPVTKLVFVSTISEYENENI